MKNLPAAACLVAIALSACAPNQKPGQTEESPIPHVMQRNGRYALCVDRAPFLILGAQVNNSSAWPAKLPEVWNALKDLNANTVEVPIYWEQLEAVRGELDYSLVDKLVKEAQSRGYRLVLLWFGTWKNGSGHYQPLWMKNEPAKHPRVIGRDGRPVDSPSPFAADTLAADKRAFAGLMRHLSLNDGRRTVIMVQVENEPGTWGSVRDFSPQAQQLFAGPVPAELLQALGRTGDSGKNWTEVFGPDADETFHAWSVARYIGQVAAAGKAEYPLPLYVNVALRDPLNPGPAGSYESGGATDNMIAVWKAAAPAVDLLAPDIYFSDDARYRKVLDLYRRPDNALFVPETGNSPAFARFFFEALGHGAIGWAPFGVDYTRFADNSLVTPRVNAATLAQFTLNYRIVAPVMRELARLNADGKLQAVAEEKGVPTQTLVFGKWKAVVTYGVPPFGPATEPRGNPEPMGRVLVAETGENEFLVAGAFCRVDFAVTDPAPGLQREYLRVTEEDTINPRHPQERWWNGDQTDWGLNFDGAPRVLRVTLGTF